MWVRTETILKKSIQYNVNINKKFSHECCLNVSPISMTKKTFFVLLLLKEIIIKMISQITDKRDAGQISSDKIKLKKAKLISTPIQTKIKKVFSQTFGKNYYITNNKDNFQDVNKNGKNIFDKLKSNTGFFPNLSITNSMTDFPQL